MVVVLPKIKAHRCAEIEKQIKYKIQNYKDKLIINSQFALTLMSAKKKKNITSLSEELLVTYKINDSYKKRGKEIANTRCQKDDCICKVTFDSRISHNFILILCFVF